MSHIVNGKFQSDKYPTCPPGKVPLSVNDPTAQDLLWEYAQRHRSVDREFSEDLETALMAAGYLPQVILIDKIRELHDLVDTADPNDPVLAALIDVGLERRP